ncbi:RagB/SusD family nutrient uptake outer membrane protein [Bacteroides sp. AN502(2024)]|uniref:RagB/SusD family nutrient uptake outer membrane protein n=1 Tax=Bacteroides sp. AN502(2024) TaxID=3160599 RepID=UPI0035180104
MKTKIFAVLALATSFSSCSDFLDRPPMDQIENSADFYNNENNIRSTIYGWYDIYFTGYQSGWVKSDFFDGTNVANWVDDLAQKEATFFTNTAPATSNDWSFANVRRINLVCDGLESSTLPEEAKKHWMGVARFFRGMEYARLVRMFGDVPYYDHVVDNTDEKALYKGRDSRNLVMDKVLDDLEFAAVNVRESDGTDGLCVNRHVVNAFESRIMLFEGTWQRYREKNTEMSKKYLEAAKTAANRVMSTQKYQISSDYKSLTISLDLANNPEMILYRSYVEGILTHAEMSWQSEQTLGNGPSKDLVDSYLTNNGLPIHQEGNSAFKGDKVFKDEMANRDPRLAANIDPEGVHLNGITGAVYGIGGYFGTRFINEDLFNTAAGQSNTNTTDAPIMKLNEVFLNYLEAAAELHDMGAYTLSQNDLDITINKIRKRTSVNMPSVTLSGNNFSVKGVVINDPDRDLGNPEIADDYEVSPILWEVRRERRIELVYEGIRFDDIRRWSKLHYADMKINKKLNLGAWLDKDAYLKEYNQANGTSYTIDDLKDVVLDREGNAGYIKPIQATSLLRVYGEKDYLYPIPTGQISLYKSKSEQLGDPSIKLEQNPNW